jgi:hypothetical protein
LSRDGTGQISKNLKFITEFRHGLLRIIKTYTTADFYLYRIHTFEPAQIGCWVGRVLPSPTMVDPGAEPAPQVGGAKLKKKKKNFRAYSRLKIKKKIKNKKKPLGQILLFFFL